MGDFPGFFDFTRPGHGVIDDSHYHPFVRFWMRYGRHLMKLIQVNFLYAVMTLPVYVWLVSQINVATAQADGKVTSLLGTLLMYFAVQMPVPLVVGLLVLSILIMGPATAAMTYFAIDCAWDRPGLLWARFWSAWKKNWKQAFPVGLMDFAVLLASLYYLIDGKAILGAMGGVFQIVWILFALVYSLIRVYIFPVMVTIDLPFLALVKNCLILVLLKPWRPLAVAAIAAALCFLCTVADIILLPCFLFSFVAFSAAFFAQPVIEEYLIKSEENCQNKE